jgi:endonuclease YncB( thermonuclease family)
MKSNCYVYYIDIIKVIDGDSIRAKIDLGFDISLEKIIRLLDVDAPEVRTLNGEVKKYGLRAKEKLEEYLTLEDDSSKLVFHSTTYGDDKYGRLLGKIYKEGSSYTANEYLLLNEYAWYYTGEKRGEDDLSSLKSL